MANCVGKVLNSLARKCQGTVGSALRQYDITAAEEPFLMALLHHEGLTQEELTAIVGVDKAATARAVKALEEKGYLTRVQDARDKRQNRVYATCRAEEVGPAVREELMQMNETLTRGFSEEEVALAHALLKRMEENLNT